MSSVKKPEPYIIRSCLFLASFVVIVAGMRVAAPILVPFLLAVFLAILFTPFLYAMRRRGISTPVALLVLVVLLAAVTVGGGTFIGKAMLGFKDNLPKYQTSLTKQTQVIYDWAEARGVQLPENPIGEEFTAQTAFRYVGNLINTFTSLLGMGFLILLIVIFILLEAAILPAKIRALPGLSEENWERMVRSVESVRTYVGMKTLTSLLTGVLVTVLLLVLRVDYPILWGLLAFLLNFIPNIGSIIAAIPGVLLAVIQYGLFWGAATAAGYLVINVAVGNFLEPRFMGRGLGLSPLIILMSMIFWGWVLGPVGMLLSVPLTMVIKMTFESDDETRWIALLLGSKVPGEKE